MRFKSVVTALMAMTVMATGIVSFSGTAQAEPFEFHMQNVKTSECLDSNSSGDVYTRPCQFGNMYQTWYKVNIKGDQLRNKATGRCLDNAEKEFKVYTNPCDENGNNRYQRWNQWTKNDLRKYTSFATTRALVSNGPNNATMRNHSYEWFDSAEQWRTVNFG
ncbi:RICIN domain-containing protein [Actinoplanes sp. TRM 88003]|uniref:RICIN domain-containing protein n=1 Tax=Paractinoplanes aksuensis TaxID=2939490 RepID=A0ABT1E4H9_9ACTN|nr:ricin-type beta-trefoil lectin domain protein [Actinoplanes aksuensis]MCO8278041.1 RICIN domain-containing protein [Actinoplanes aksuensis]